MGTRTRSTLIPKLLIALLLVLIIALFWASQPFIDRTAKGSNPVPLRIADAALPATTLDRLTDFVEKRAAGIDAFIALRNGRVVFDHGPTDVPTNLHSARKSVLSVLFGIAHAKGLVDIHATLADLGVDEPGAPLTEVERSATVEMLLQARSGVYLASGAETQNMKDGRPARGQFAPGEHFYYNNWDFNVLGAIFEQETSLPIGEALDQWLAQPLGMEDFHPSHVIYDRDAASTRYRTYRIHMSARDLARIGLLIQQKGAWSGKQIVPADWVELTTRAASSAQTRAYDGYGYLWWSNSERDVIAGDGWGGQFLHIDRNGPYVLVSRRDTGNSRLGYLKFISRSQADDPLHMYEAHDILSQDAL